MLGFLQVWIEVRVIRSGLAYIVSIANSVAIDSHNSVFKSCFVGEFSRNI